MLDQRFMREFERLKRDFRRLKVLENIPNIVSQVEVWATSEAYQLLTINRDSDGVVTSATVEWPDGSSGIFTTSTKNTTWLAIDAYTISHTASSRMVTQTAVTRDASGNITIKPLLTVA